MFYVSKASPWPQTPRGLLFTTNPVTHFAAVSLPFPNPFPSFAYRSPLAFDFRAPVIASFILLIVRLTVLLDLYTDPPWLLPWCQLLLLGHPKVPFFSSMSDEMPFSLEEPPWMCL